MLVDMTNEKLIKEIEREIELDYKYLAALRVKAESQGMFSPIWEQISDIYVEIRELKEELEELI